MNQSEFLAEVAATLDMTEPLTPATVLADIPDYDSLAILNLLALYDGIGVATTPDKVTEAVTARDLIDIAGGALDDA